MSSNEILHYLVPSRVLFVPHNSLAFADEIGTTEERFIPKGFKPLAGGRAQRTPPGFPLIIEWHPERMPAGDSLEAVVFRVQTCTSSHPFGMHGLSASFPVVSLRSTTG